jgi:hypothetical protein
MEVRKIDSFCSSGNMEAVVTVNIQTQARGV